MRPIDIIRRLRREGWIERQGKGPHPIFRRNGKRVVIAQHPGDIPTGTLREICRQAGSDFADVPQQARDALATAVEDMLAEGEPLPPSVEESGRAEIEASLSPTGIC
ncbi:MAG: type II toxin-antitoxin system HicA family toxin [Alphaproteobacteria bacterium]